MERCLGLGLLAGAQTTVARAPAIIQAGAAFTLAKGIAAEKGTLMAEPAQPRDEARTLKALGTGLRGDKSGEVDELARLQGNELIARLACLKDAGS